MSQNGYGSLLRCCARRCCSCDVAEVAGAAAIAAALDEDDYEDVDDDHYYDMRRHAGASKGSDRDRQGSLPTFRGSSARDSQGHAETCRDM